jgi:hypothetical protein
MSSTTTTVTKSATTTDAPLNSLSLKGAPQPLQRSGVLDKFEHFDATPVIGTEFVEAEDVQLAKWLEAPNSDELIKDLAVLSEFKYYAVL